MDKLYYKFLSQIRYKPNTVRARPYHKKRNHTPCYFFVCLLGFMGSGKTTFGKKLANSLNAIFIDTDSLIEEKEHMSIPSIFETRGEPYFRMLEYKTVQSIFTKTNAYTTNFKNKTSQCKNKWQQNIIIISLGGGTIQATNIRKLFRSNAYKTLTIWLSCPLPIIKQRLFYTNNRPLFNAFKNSVKLNKLYKKRFRLYKSSKQITLYQKQTQNWSIP